MPGEGFRALKNTDKYNQPDHEPPALANSHGSVGGWITLISILKNLIRLGANEALCIIAVTLSYVEGIEVGVPPLLWMTLMRGAALNEKLLWAGG